MRLRLLALALGLASCGRARESADCSLVPEIALATLTKTQYPVQYEEALRLAEGWKMLGLAVRVEPLNFPNPVIERLFTSHAFDAVMLYFTPQVERLEPDFFTFHTFHSSNAGPGSWNFAGFESPEFDRLAEAQRREYDESKRLEQIRACQQLLFRESPWLVVVNPDELQAYNRANFDAPVIPKVSGFKDAMALFALKPRGERREVRFAVEWADLRTINPLLVSESTQVRLLHLIYDTLVRIGPDTRPQPWAAENVRAIDERTVEVVLRQGLRFHDGHPLTAEDVRFTFDFMREHKSVYFTAFLDPLDSVEVSAPRTVRFRLKHPYVPFVSQTLGLTPLLPRHVWKEVENPSEYRNLPPVGSGPFRFVHWKEAQEFKMARFDEHFRAPAAEGLLFVFYGTREAAFNALVRDEADVVDILLPHQLQELQGLAHIQTVAVPSHASDSLVFNLRRRPFSDGAFRLALAHTVPGAEVRDELYLGHASVGGSIIAPANEMWSDRSIEPRPRDLEAARRLLQEAGYRWDHRGRLCYPPD